MDNDTRRAYEPQGASHPGEFVVEYLEFNGWSQRELARRTGLTPKTISEICNGKAPITATTALTLEKVFQRPAHFWLNLQRQFDESEARKRVAVRHHGWQSWAEMFPPYHEWQEWAAKFPLAEMSHYHWLEAANKQSKVDALLNFFGVSSPDSWNAVWQSCNVAYRQTRKFHTSMEAISVWVRASEVMARQLDYEVKEFNRGLLADSLEGLKLQTGQRPEVFIPKIQSLCAEAGVAVVWVPELKHTGISGCARWLTDKKALVALTLRYKTDDEMWFTFFHEIGHILLHRKKFDFILDNADESLTDQVIDPMMQQMEEEANRFAADTLIPPRVLCHFIQKKDFSSDAILSLAEELGIGPGLVVGRLQREGLLAYSQGNSLKQRLAWAFNKAR